MSNNCLVCGFKQSGKTTLLKNLTATESKKNFDTNITDNNNIRYYEWTIRNKYYNSDILFTIINDLQAFNKIDSKTFQALILVININENKKIILNKIDEWHSTLEPNLSSIDCCLLIANYSTLKNEKCNIQSLQEYEEFHNTLNNWCVDNSFELILSPFNDNNNVINEKDNKTNFGCQSSIFKNYDISELGFKRVDGALQCVSWPSMTRNVANLNNNKNKKKINLNDDNDDDKNNNENQPLSNFGSKHGFISEEKISTNDVIEHKYNDNENNNEINEFKNNDENSIKNTNENTNENKIENEENNINEKNKKKTTHSENNDECISDEENHNNNNNESEQKEFISNLLWQQITEQKEKRQNNQNNNNNDDDDDDEQNNDDNNMENQLVQFQSLIEEMQNVRAQSKSGNLTHEERRERASRTALKLMQFMGLDDDDNDELLNEID